MIWRQFMFSLVINSSETFTTLVDSWDTKTPITNVHKTLRVPTNKNTDLQPESLRRNEPEIPENIVLNKKIVLKITNTTFC